MKNVTSLLRSCVRFVHKEGIMYVFEDVFLTNEDVGRRWWSNENALSSGKQYTWSDYKHVSTKPAFDR